MAKSDSFFIRAESIVDVTPAFAQTEIDLGSFVNLGVSKSTLLRIHNIQVQYYDSTSFDLTRTSTLVKTNSSRLFMK